MAFQRLLDEVDGLLSEAAIEISNLDCRENVIYRRLRNLQTRLRLFAEVNLAQEAFDDSLERLAAALQAEPVQVLKAVAGAEVGELRLAGQVVAVEQLQTQVGNNPQLLSSVNVKLSAVELWSIIDALALAAVSPSVARSSPIGKQRKFSGSEASLPASAEADQQRTA